MALPTAFQLDVVQPDGLVLSERVVECMVPGALGSSIASTGSWLASTPIEPTVVRVEIISTSSLNTSPSGVTKATERGIAQPASFSARLMASSIVPTM